MKASEEKFRKVFENSVTGMAVNDAEGRIVTVNPAFCRMVGYSEAELTGLGGGPLVESQIDAGAEDAADPLEEQKIYLRRSRRLGDQFR
ncbi:MAG: PAS domain S-box protein [Rhodospirillales bacterium]|nr:PAS domain S-box protein [Rhodospirillales bacterium]